LPKGLFLRNEVDHDNLQEAELLCNQLISTILANNLFIYAMPLLNSIDIYYYSHDNEDLLFVRKFLCDFRNQYGNKCVSELNYSEAITSFLSCRIPNVSEAIQTARKSGSILFLPFRIFLLIIILIEGNWSLALTIAGKFFVTNSTSSMILSQAMLAQEIINEFREHLEQGEIAGNIMGGVYTSTFDIDSISFNSNDDKIREASRMCIDYCNDHEGSISILIIGHQWLDALKIATKFNRRDLQEEVT
jgi:hypothetical protein